MAEKVKKWTQRIITAIFAIVALIISVKLLGFSDQTSAITPLIVVGIGICTLVELGVRRLMGIVNRKFEYSDITDGAVALASIATIIAGIGLYFGYGITIISAIAGWIVLVTTIVLLIQLFTI